MPAHVSDKSRVIHEHLEKHSFFNTYSSSSGARQKIG